MRDLVFFGKCVNYWGYIYIEIGLIVVNKENLVDNIEVLIYLDRWKFCMKRVK